MASKKTPTLQAWDTVGCRRQRNRENATTDGQFGGGAGDAGGALGAPGGQGARRQRLGAAAARRRRGRGGAAQRRRRRRRRRRAGLAGLVASLGGGGGGGGGGGRRRRRDGPRQTRRAGHVRTAGAAFQRQVRRRRVQALAHQRRHRLVEQAVLLVAFIRTRVR